MRLREIILENYRVITTDERANRSNGDELLDDVESDKIIVKWAPEYRRPEQILAVFYLDPENSINREHPFSIILYGDGTFVSNESYHGEAIPVLKFLINRWPAYAEFEHLGEDGGTMREIAQRERPRVAANTTWFHGTSSIKAAAVTRLGLMPQAIGDRLYRGLRASLDGVVYLTNDQETAMMHAGNAVKQRGGAPVILKVDISGLEDRIITDQDADNFLQGGNVDVRRVRKRAGEASFLTLGTIAFRGRIPANRISIAFQGKMSTRKASEVNKTDQLAFVQALARLVVDLDKPDLTTLFHIIAAQPSGWSGGMVRYADEYYANVERLLYSVYRSKTAPARFAQWLRGMQRRCGIWRRRNHPIAALIDATNKKLTKTG